MSLLCLPLACTNTLRLRTYHTWTIHGKCENEFHVRIITTQLIYCCIGTIQVRLSRDCSLIDVPLSTTWHLPSEIVIWTGFTNVIWRLTTDGKFSVDICVASASLSNTIHRTHFDFGWNDEKIQTRFYCRQWPSHIGPISTVLRSVSPSFYPFLAFLLSTANWTPMDTTKSPTQHP